MIDVTPIARHWFAHRVRTAHGWTGTQLRATQEAQLRYLLAMCRKTHYGAHHDVSAVRDYDSLRRTIPVVSYPDIRQYVERMVQGAPDVLWPGVTRRFAQSSGTSDGKSKYIPITDDSLRINHYRGASDAVAHYLCSYNKASHLFGGKAFILGGSFANEVHNLPRGVRVGDLSANLIDAVNPLVNIYRIPDKEVALMADWHDKLPVLVEASLHADVTNISGVPSWFLTVLRRVIEAAGADTIHDVWPRLEVFFHGGISFEPYREQYRAITDPERMHYVETYNASEGFFAVQDDPTVRAMQLILDAGVFYEFVPLSHIDDPLPPSLAPWQVREGETYALIVSAPNGLYRYAIGDTVRIASVAPLRITIAGRTKHYINAFGEEVMVHNTDAAIAHATRQTGCAVANYTVCPVFATPRHKGHHRWMIEWDKPPHDVEAFAQTLDRCLQDENSDYQAKRSGDIFMGRLRIESVPHGTFDRWLASTGKLGGQRKIPRLCPDDKLQKAIRALCDNPTDNT